jgi:hypothetical protein
MIRAAIMHKIAITAIIVHASCWLLPADASKNVTSPAPSVPQSSKNVTAPLVVQSSNDVTSPGPLVSQSSKSVTSPTALLPQSSKPLTPRVPSARQSGIKIVDFVDKGWRVYKEAVGDLNGDGQKDAVVVCIKKHANPDHIFVPVPAVLMVLFADQHGYQTKCFLPIADVNGQDSNLRLEEVKIDHGNIVITVGSGANQIFHFDFKWRWQGGNFELIGMTEMHGNVTDGTYTRDYNLNTGYAESYDSTNAFGDGSKHTVVSTADYVLRAGAVATVPDMNRKILPPPVPGQSIKLKRSVNVALGKADWKGPSDFSALVSAVHDDKVLFVSALVTEKNPEKFTTLRLTDEENHHILPNALVTPSKNGVLIEARFLLSQLDSAMAKDTLQPRDSKVYKLSLEVVRPKSGSAPAMVLSTNCSPRGAGEIHLTRTKALPLLKDWNWQKRVD